MAIGDDAIASGYATVPESGENGRVRWGAREINRTRDFLAQIKQAIPNVWPINRGGTGGTTKIEAKTSLGITYGALLPTGGSEGDIYFRIL